MSTLEHRFQKVCENLRLSYDDGFYGVLDALYSHPSRHYHNWRHIEVVLDRVEKLANNGGSAGVDLDLVRFAVFHHDVIYVPGFRLNEQLSADIAQKHYEAMGGMWFRSEIDARTIRLRRYIMSTKWHKPTDPGERLISDADLYGLGTDYHANGLNVYEEFKAAGDLTIQEWVEGRIAFLEAYLAHDPLFHLSGQEELEEQARDHMTVELHTLRT